MIPLRQPTISIKLSGSELCLGNFVYYLFPSLSASLADFHYECTLRSLLEVEVYHHLHYSVQNPEWSYNILIL